ncbi:hypothetical protein HPB51_011636 [Rhipicephalus microplus]|uniref:Uncharacterized protein n=1 Tax=Rhipicephalus microplus TaxID=6941 RepID=A0A9J6ETE4_RHIMP|nr:hypothetical protein HPB51_011636 [Rhipicephalus microplus]
MQSSTSKQDTATLYKHRDESTRVIVEAPQMAREQVPCISKLSMALSEKERRFLEGFGAGSIKRDEKVLTETCVVWSRHFDERFIQRTFRHVINGDVVKLDRERPVLTKDTVPTIFPDAPSYFTKQLPKKRAERNLGNSYLSPAKRRALNNDPAEDPKTQTCTNESSQGPCPLGEIELPSAFCSKIPLPCDANALFFAWHTGTEPCDVRVSKFVTFLMSIEAAATQENFYTCSVFCHGIKMEELCVNKEFDPAKALKKVDEIRLCPGYGVVPVTNGQCMRFGIA